MNDSFGQILSRGLRAAHRSTAGLLLFFLLYGWYQGAGLVFGAAVGSDPRLFQMQPGQAPPPELLWLMGYGCFSCVWILVTLFAGPWVAGGVIGQLRDRVAAPDAPVGSFRAYASAYYGRFLLLTVLYLATLFVLYLVLMLVGMLIAGSALQGEPLGPAQLQSLNSHPANIASGVVFGFALAAVAVLFNLADSAIVVEQVDAISGLGRAWSFMTRRFGDAFRLFLVYAALGVPVGLLYSGPALLQLRELPVLAVVGVLLACYFPYLIMIDLAFAISLWLARHPRPEGMPEDAGGGGSRPV